MAIAVAKEVEEGEQRVVEEHAGRLVFKKSTPANVG